MVRAAASLASFPDLLRRTPRWIKRTTRQLLVRDALIAVDGRHAGASHREVAEVSVGRKRVREEWSARGGWLKERMRLTRWPARGSQPRAAAGYVVPSTRRSPRCAVVA
jgi:hypothetical protein